VRRPALADLAFELAARAANRLPGSLRESAGEQLRRRWLTRLMSTEPWCIDAVGLAGEVVEVKGWAIPPAEGHEAVTLTVNDRPFDEYVGFPGERPDVARLYGFCDRAGRTAFHCRAWPSRELFASGQAVFKYVRRATRRSLREEHDYYYPDVATDALPLPDPARRTRVHGAAEPSAFRLEGYTTFVKLRQTLKRVAGRNYDDFPRVLDWGCGCGRVSRYFARVPRVALTGVDVDADNVRWCGQHLGFGRFLAIPLHPPTELPSDAFDLVIGISVFTHLGEEDQLQWLAELRRVTRPGGLVLVSIHGGATVCRAMWDLALLQRWTREGFLAGANPTLDDVLSEPGYYKNAFHTPDYVRRRWSAYFEILDIVPGYVGNAQDLVVMRRPPP
jgi:SAM-dependent methyltransferase